MLIAQITDLHVKNGRRLAYKKVDTARATENAVAHINAMSDPIDVVLVSGDVVDAGSEEEYLEVRPILDQLRAPYYVIPGNHDLTPTMLSVFADKAYVDPSMDHFSYVIDDYPLRLIGLDTSVAGEPYGHLPSARLDWLERNLSNQSKKPTMIFMHHPPFRMGIAHMDVQNLQNADALFDLIGQHSQVIHIAAGHIHRASETVINGIGCSTAPAPAHAVTPDFSPDGVPSYTIEPAMLRLFRFTENQLISHLVPIGTFDGPHPFFQADGSLID